MSVMVTCELRPYTAAEMSAALRYAALVVSRMSVKGFYICSINVSVGQKTNIKLFNNERCQELAQSGFAKTVLRSTGCSDNKGVFCMYGCEFEWLEGVIHE